MDAKQLKQLKPELELFLDRYAPCFPLDAHAEHARKFVQGLLLGADRRNTENIAEGVEGGVVRSMQKFIGQGRWSDDPIQEELRQHVVEVLGDSDAILSVDETGMPKKGTKSVGVKRQYAGCLGRVDNCQIGVFVNYCSAKDHTLIDRRLYLPEDWAQDRVPGRSWGAPGSRLSYQARIGSGDGSPSDQSRHAFSMGHWGQHLRRQPHVCSRRA